MFILFKTETDWHAQEKCFAAEPKLIDFDNEKYPYIWLI